MNDNKYMLQYYDGLYQCWRDIPRLTFDTKEVAHANARLYQTITSRVVRVKEIKND